MNTTRLKTEKATQPQRSDGFSMYNELQSLQD